MEILKPINPITRNKMISLSNKHDIEILAYLKKNGPTMVKTIKDDLKITQAFCGLCLRRLREAKAVKFKHDGRKIYYSVDYQEIIKGLREISGIFTVK